MAINQTERRSLFTKKLIDVYQERIPVMGFLRSFFPSVKPAAKLVSIEVERGYEKIASDVVRGTEGNRNTFSRNSEKIYEPPIYREYFDATQLDLYDRVLGAEASDNSRQFAALMNTVADRLALLKDKIERAYELQCAQVLETGIAQLQNGDNIDFKRKATSLVDLLAGNYWPNNVDVFQTVQNGCNFLRKVGKASGQRFTMILGDEAIAALYNNTKFTARQDLVNMRIDTVNQPQRNSVGGVYHGTITAGPYLVDMWSYPQYYDNDSNVATAYIHTKKIIIIPQTPRFKLGHGLVPQVLNPGSLANQGEYVIGEFMDERKAVHDFDIQSAGIAIPVAVDQIYTAQVVAS